MTTISYDLFSREFKRNPLPTFAAMRQNDPIYLHVAPNGMRIWYITRYEDVLAVLKDDEHFCKNLGNAMPASSPHKNQTQNILHLVTQNMLFADPPDHTRLRKLVNQAFTPRRVAQMEARVQAIADNLIDAVIERGEMDLIADFALPLPFKVIVELLGLPAFDHPQLQHWSQAIISPGSRGISTRERKRRIRAFVEYIALQFEQRRITPQDDLLTGLIEAEEAGDKLTAEELSSMVMLLLVTGYETTVNLIGNGIVTLLQHPEQLQIVREMPALWEPAVEELLRYDGPVETSTSRWARTDLLFKGHQMQRGDYVRVVLSSANRDAAQNSCPDEFVVDQEECRHLGFGFGIHYCLGAPLARLEGKVSFETLFRRLPELRLGIPVAELEWRSGVLFRGVKKLPLVWNYE